MKKERESEGKRVQLGSITEIAVYWSGKGAEDLPTRKGGDFRI